MKKYLSKVMSAVASLSLVASAIGVMPSSADAAVAYDYVDVTAQVNGSLSFDIVDAADATTTVSTCDLGVLLTTAVNECSYGLRIATNNPTGFSAKYRGATELINGTSQYIAHVLDGEVTMGSEEYGLQIASSTDGGYSAPNTFANPSIVNSGWNGPVDKEITTSTSTEAVHYTTPFDSHKGTGFWQNSTLTVVTHRASISVGTPVGSYTQKVWWEVTENP